MRLSIVIPTLNEELYLPRLLNSISAQGVDRDDLDVIVVDASASDLVEMACLPFHKDLSLRVMKAPRPDVGEQRNLGAACSRFDDILFADADILFGSDLADTIATVCARYVGRSFVASIRHTADRKTMFNRCVLGIIYFLVALARFRGFPVTNGDFILTNRTTFNVIGGFRTGYLLGEDTDFGYRAAEAGAKTPYIWSRHVVASSRRFEMQRPVDVLRMWIGAYLQVIRGRGPSGSRRDDSLYPYGLWGADHGAVASPAPQLPSNPSVDEPPAAR